MNKFKIILTASIAATLILSCSNEGDDSSNGDTYTEVYTLKDKTADRFTYLEDGWRESCSKYGVYKIEKFTDEYTINYSIKNNIMTWQEEWGNDTLNFKGTQNELIGTWTRTKNKKISCEIYYDDEYDESWLDCKDDWDITKAVFTKTNVEITRDYCGTDYIIDGETWRKGDGSWKVRPTGCHSLEVYKEANKITIKENGIFRWEADSDGITVKGNEIIEVSYNGKSCKTSEPSKSQKEVACREAWNEHKDEYFWSEYYLDNIQKDFYDCLKQSMPEGFWIDRDDYYAYRKITTKPIAKVKFTPLLKKRN